MILSSTTTFGGSKVAIGRWHGATDEGMGSDMVATEERQGNDRVATREATSKLQEMKGGCMGNGRRRREMGDGDTGHGVVDPGTSDSGQDRTTIHFDPWQHTCSRLFC